MNEKKRAKSIFITHANKLWIKIFQKKCLFSFFLFEICVFTVSQTCFALFDWKYWIWYKICMLQNCFAFVVGFACWLACEMYFLKICFAELVLSEKNMTGYWKKKQNSIWIILTTEPVLVLGFDGRTSPT